MDEVLAMRMALNSYQIQRLEETYGDINAPTMKSFFFSQLYPPLEVAEGQKKRNADFHQLTQHWMVRLILQTGLIKGLSKVVDLHNLTEELDRRMLDKLVLNDKFSIEAYNSIYSQVTTREERNFQVDLLLDSFNFVKAVVENPRFHLEGILNRLPKFLMANSDLLRLARDGYRVFDEHRSLLPTFAELIRQRELAYIERMFKNSP